MTDLADYFNFLSTKLTADVPTGMPQIPDIHPSLYPFQQDIARWALRRGRAAIFADCGLGKTPMQLEWAKHVQNYTGRGVLILAPLAVAAQTKREGEKFGIPVKYCQEQAETAPGVVTVTNYEKLHRFDPAQFAGVVLDESSILKSFDGKFRTRLIEAFRQTPFRLACTATPAPNDFMELGNHAEFLGVMTRAEMLAMFFCHDGGDTSHWRLKGHAEHEFWHWLCSWAVNVRKPGDLGYSDDGFILPDLRVIEDQVTIPLPAELQGCAPASLDLSQRRLARHASLAARVAAAATLVNQSTEPWLVWCDLNAESEALAKAIPGAVEVRGSDKPEDKEKDLSAFSRGEIRVLVTKPTIAGFGLNWQHCARMAFVGLSDSYEQFYQAVRRCWRFGQQQPVEAHIITSQLDEAVLANIQRKEEDAARLAQEMVRCMAALNRENIQQAKYARAEYVRQHTSGAGWTLHQGDCVEVIREMPSDSIHYSVFSPPFASLYTYSNSERDMGNCRDDQEFFAHFRFLVGELYRVTRPGRLCSFHCMNLPKLKSREGVIGLKDFRGDLIRLFERAGWIYHSEVCIWKCPVQAVTRTKALGLLHKQLKKDSCMSRQGIADYLVTMRKPGDNPEQVTHTDATFPVSVWQKYASPVWMDIKSGDTLQRLSAREEKDERHICPLQLKVIERVLRLWSNPGDLVLSPFAGIGSEGYQAIRMGRRFVGAELKGSYYRQAAANLRAAESAPPIPLETPEDVADVA